MSEKTGYRIKKKLLSDTFSIPRKLISRLSEAGECELKIFLVLASLETEEYLTEEDILEELEKAGVSTCDYSEGMAFLRGAGLIEKSTAKAKERSVKSEKHEEKEEKKEDKKEEKEEKRGEHRPSSKPSYTSKQLADALKDNDFRQMVEWASARMGKSFNPSDVSTLYSFRDYLCLPCDVIMLAIEHCASEDKTSLRYVEKLLIDFADREINTYQKAEDYIIRRKNYLSFEGKMRTMMGLGQRSLTSKEKSMLTQWQEWEMSEELIRLAYEKTVEKTGHVSMSYMHKILDSWHTAGFKTTADVERGDKKPTEGGSTYDLDDFFKAAVESSLK